jgi:uncharacterized protein (TIGR02996 family)
MGGQIESFLHAIREAPEDDVPRLVLADWLEDNGEADRAEFIRAQVRLDGDLPAGERPALKAREAALLAQNKERWLGPLAQKPWEPTFSRGTARLKVQTGRLLNAKVQKQAQEWFTPALVTDLRAEGTTSRWNDLIDLPLLEGLAGFVISKGKTTTADVQALARSPRLANLRRLGIHGERLAARNGMDKAGMTALIESPHLKRLTGVDFAGKSLDHEAMELLTKEAPWKLTSLNLDGTALHDYTLGLLLEAPWLPGLTWLSVYAAIWIDEAVRWFVRDLAPTRLRFLCLGSNRVGDGSAEVIASSPHLAELRELWLNFPHFTERGARALAGSPYLAKLRLLYLYSMDDDTPEGKILRGRFGDVACFDWQPRQ